MIFEKRFYRRLVFEEEVEVTLVGTGSPFHFWSLLLLVGLLLQLLFLQLQHFGWSGTGSPFHSSQMQVSPSPQPSS